MNTGHGETTGYAATRTTEFNFEVTSPDTTMYETFYLNAMTNFNLAQWPVVLVLDKAATGQGLKLSVLSGRHQLLFEDLAVSTHAPAAAADVPQAFTLLGNYPNPFNPATTIALELAEPASVGVALFDLLGRAVLTVPARAMQAGAQTVTLNAGRAPLGPVHVSRGGAGRDWPAVGATGPDDAGQVDPQAHASLPPHPASAATARAAAEGARAADRCGGPHRVSGAHRRHANVRRSRSAPRSTSPRPSAPRSQPPAGT